MRRAVIALCLIGLSQPVVARSLFDALTGAERPTLAACMAIPENKAWISIVIQQLRERVPRLNLGPGSVTIKFHVDYAGRVSRITFSKYENNAQALVAANVIAALKLPPPPFEMDSDCRDFTQSFRFH